eukprot:3940303-Rhodomonas_salina.3
MTGGAMLCSSAGAWLAACCSTIRRVSTAHFVAPYAASYATLPSRRSIPGAGSAVSRASYCIAAYTRSVPDTA